MSFHVPDFSGKSICKVKMSSTSETTKANFTCITCYVAFKEADLQRLHYKTDWHRYNLKRKVAELPPVSSEEFQKRVFSQRENDQKALEDKSVYCQVCKKSFGNSKAYTNHLNSKKHKDNEKSYVPGSSRAEPISKESEVEDEMDVEEVDSDEWDDNPIDNNDCLFCDHHSKNFIKNLEHMTTVHSFFIPDIEFCSDVHGLLRYLGEKVSEGYMCLWCNEKGKTFHSADAAKKHMVDKGHCRMLHEGLALAEYADFYDYSASYPDANDENVDKDEEINVPEIEGNDYQLVLPSGAVVGHRSLMRYYKQSLNPNSTQIVAKDNRKLHKFLATFRALGWPATQQEAAARKAKDIHYMKRLQSKLKMNLGVKANKLQKHFRPQVNF